MIWVFALALFLLSAILALRSGHRLRRLSPLAAVSLALLTADVAQARGFGLGFGLRRPRQVNVQNNFFGGGVPAQAAFFPAGRGRAAFFPGRSFGYGTGASFAFQRPFAPVYTVPAAPAFYYQPPPAQFAPAYSGCGASLSFGYGVQAAPLYAPGSAPSCAGAAFQFRY